MYRGVHALGGEQSPAGFVNVFAGQSDVGSARRGRLQTFWLGTFAYGGNFAAFLRSVVWGPPIQRLKSNAKRSSFERGLDVGFRVCVGMYVVADRFNKT
jgi:hypothetical protein